MTDNKPTIILLTGLGVNHRFMIPYQLYLRSKGWKCEIVKNTTFATNNVVQYSNDLKDVLNNVDSAYLIGFSLGGLTSAYTMADSEFYLNKVKKAFTVCSPLVSPAEWAYNNRVLRFLCNNVPVSDIFLPNPLKTLRKLGKEFQHHVLDSRIMRSPKALGKVHALFHRNDLISPPDRSFFAGMEKTEIAYRYPWAPKLFHHHIACADPRVFLDILKEINS